MQLLIKNYVIFIIYITFFIKFDINNSLNNKIYLFVRAQIAN